MICDARTNIDIWISVAENKVLTVYNVSKNKEVEAPENYEKTNNITKKFLLTKFL